MESNLIDKLYYRQSDDKYIIMLITKKNNNIIYRNLYVFNHFKFHIIYNDDVFLNEIDKVLSQYKEIKNYQYRDLIHGIFIYKYVEK